MVDFLEQLKADGSALTYDTMHRSVADGDFVLTYSEGSIAGERHFFCELWRIEDGAWVELWDAIGPVAPDDDPEFLRRIADDVEAEKRRRRHRAEAEERARAEKHGTSAAGRNEKRTEEQSTDADPDNGPSSGATGPALSLIHI